MRNLILAILFVLTSPVHAGNQAIVNADLFNGVYAPKNYVLNSHFEKNSLHVVDSSSKAARTTDSPVDGDASLAIDMNEAEQVVKITLKDFDKSLLGGNCGAFFWYNGDARLYKTYVEQNGVVVSGTAVQLENVSSDEGRQTPHLNFPCGDNSHTTYVVIEATDDAAEAIKIDNVYGGKALNIGTVAQARWVGSISWQGTANCEWSKTGTGYTDFPADSDCPDPVVKGSLRAPSTKVPGFNLDVLPGHYEIKVTDALVQASIGTTGLYRWSDGTNAFGGSWTGSGDNRGSTSLDGTITYSAPQSDVPFRIQAQNFTGGNTARLYNQQVDRGLTVDVYYFPTQSQTAVRMDQTDYDWKDDANVPSFNGLGTITNLVYKTRRVGSELWAKGSFTTGTVSGSTVASISLPPNIVIDASKITTVAAGIKVGESYQPPAGTVYIFPGSNGNSAASQILFFDGSDTSTLFFAYRSNSGAFNKDMGGGIFESSRVVTFEFKIPVEGWTENQNAPPVVGGVTSSYGDVMRVESMTVSSAGVVTEGTGDWIDGDCAVTSTAIYTCAVNSGIFSGNPICTVNILSVGGSYDISAQMSTMSASSIAWETKQPTGAHNARATSLICIGPR